MEKASSRPACLGPSTFYLLSFFFLHNLRSRFYLLCFSFTLTSPFTSAVPLPTSLPFVVLFMVRLQHRHGRLLCYSLNLNKVDLPFPKSLFVCVFVFFLTKSLPFSSFILVFLIGLIGYLFLSGNKTQISQEFLKVL